MFGSIRTAIIAASAPEFMDRCTAAGHKSMGIPFIYYHLYSFVDRTVKVHIPPPANSKK